MRVGENIKRAREARGWSLERLAAKLPADQGKPVHYSTIGRLEQGKRGLTLEWVERIAGALGMDPVELVAGRPSQPTPDFSLDESVAGEIARTLALVAREGEPPSSGTVQALALMLQELTVTFARHPQAYRDPAVALPVIDLVSRRSDRASN